MSSELYGDSLLVWGILNRETYINLVQQVHIWSQRRSMALSRESGVLLIWGEQYPIPFRPRHLRGNVNLLADTLSRNTFLPREGSLLSSLFQAVAATFKCLASSVPPFPTSSFLGTVIGTIYYYDDFFISDGVTPIAVTIWSLLNDKQK